MKYEHTVAGPVEVENWVAEQMARIAQIAPHMINVIDAASESSEPVASKPPGPPFTPDQKG
jgi:hypothetical protein